ncbi:F-box protein [Nymphaea thermarum]|nr:F-box protein [Nymphaea thermarum]
MSSRADLPVSGGKHQLGKAAAYSSSGDATDHFDRLPDSLLLLIFNKIGDVKALGRCCVVSKRFQLLACQVDNVLIKVDCVISDDDSSCISPKGKGVLSNLIKFLLVPLFLKPFQTFTQILASSSSPKKPSSATSAAGSLSEISHHSPTEVLKNFNEIQSLSIVLPGGELGVEDGVLLKWKADFGSTLDSCVILGASSFSSSSSKKLTSRVVPQDDSGESPVPSSDDGGSIPESFFTNGGLKLRVVWTISALIAASARHFLLQQIICQHPTLERLVLTDSDGQGVLCMNKEQMQELRVKPLNVSASSNRTQVPALNMKLWYAPYVELAGGMVLKGATLMAIRPSDHVGKESDGWISMAFEEPFRTAAASLAKRRTYCLEMNSF